MARRNVEVISCDWCGRDLVEKESLYFIDINGEQNEEICQGVAFPFEMRMAIEELREVKEV